MDNSKYIIVMIMGIETPILFPSFVDHCKVAEIFGGVDNVVSAGMFEVGAEPTKNDDRNIFVSVFGKSTTLQKEPKDDDDYHIQKLLRKQYKY